MYCTCDECNEGMTHRESISSNVLNTPLLLLRSWAPIYALAYHCFGDLKERDYREQVSDKVPAFCFYFCGCKCMYCIVKSPLAVLSRNIFQKWSLGGRHALDWATCLMCFPPIPPIILVLHTGSLLVLWHNIHLRGITYPEDRGREALKDPLLSWSTQAPHICFFEI